MELVTLMEIGNYVISWFNTLAQDNRRNDEDYKKALLKIYLAANETRAYIATLKKRKNQDREKEVQLAHLWTEASVELRSINPDLAQRCLLKGEYWSDPLNWDHDSIDTARISLKEVTRRAQKLL